METFALRDVRFSYPQQVRQALRGISLSVEQGEFLVLCGPSGGGKSTLLRLLKPELAPYGKKAGDILFRGRPLDDLDRRGCAEKIGFVQQNPENQLVTDKVWHELAFGLESLGYETPVIRRRVSEMASFFGIQNWFYRGVSELSGGQKQLLNLASVMAMQPEVLLLDEPTSRLDPIAAADFLAALGRINRELGTTVILSEHRLDEALPLASRAAVLEGGRILHSGMPASLGSALRQRSDLLCAMPEPMRIWAAVEGAGNCPVTVGEGRRYLENRAREHPLHPLPPEQIAPAGEEVLRAEEVWFRYEKNGADTVKGLDLSLRSGEFLALLGGNGTGKSTALSILAGLHRPWRGKCTLHGRAALLPQEVQTLFVKSTVRQDLLEVLDGSGLSRAQRGEEVARVAALCRLQDLMERHPYDLSGGEQQRAALAKILLLHPDVLLLDEPTQGMDAAFCRAFAQILRALLNSGTAILMVSHDVAFCARYAHRCALFFDGAITAEGTPRDFFSGNSFYTTAANRMARAVLPRAVTVEDVIAACGAPVPPEPDIGAPPSGNDAPPPDETKRNDGPAPLSVRRKCVALGSGALALLCLTEILRRGNFSAQTTVSNALLEMLLWGGALLAAVAVFFLAVGRRAANGPERAPLRRQKLSRRTAAAAAVSLLLVPATIFFGVFALEDRHYYLTALLVLLEIMLPFFLAFEGRKPQAREVVLVASLCALGAVGRLAFFMLPQFSPVMALVIIAAVALGGETGFLVGAVTMLVSNMALSQGPWTPWQMFAMGLVGLLAGILFQKGLLGRSRGALCAYGALAAIVIYGGIMNPASALMWMHELSPQILLAYYISGFPMDCVQAAGTVLFLWLCAAPMLEKLDRIKVKYGLIGESA